MPLTLEKIKRMTETGKICHYLECQYGGSKSREVKFAHCEGYIQAVLNYNLITREVYNILNKWNATEMISTI